MKRPIEVSIVIPTYNNNDALSRTIQSVIDQTFQDFEILIGDDGSTEDCKFAINWFRDLRIRHIRFNHQGNAARSRNYAMRHAQGKYVAFLDNDFEWRPEKLESQVIYFQKNGDLVMSWCNVSVCAGKDEIEEVCHPNKSRLWLDPVESLIFEGNIHLSTLMMRKEYLDRIGLFNEDTKIAGQEDAAFLLRVASCGPGMYDSKQKVIWHRDQKEPGRAGRFEDLSRRIEMLKDFIDYSDDKTYEKLATRQINTTKRKLAALSLIRGNFRDAGKMIFAN